ncbi:MAG: molybdenum ABC transporter permease subunit [Acidimicrobiaceae bacterium TMED130]|nr:MAG: molybdenum ABC transporter permease subunit [Acidimicrobiaceae bacterium TMED130]|tara:strand:+ start:32745 stop:33536 length:792 start_codon:yes stop_codon:yes gene_type:complete
MRTPQKSIPKGIWIIAVIGFVFLLLPFIGLAQRTPWSSFVDIATEETVLQSIGLSMIVATCSAGICLLLGIPLGWVLAKAKFKGIKFVRSIVLLPMVLPPVAGGTALLFALGRKGFIGERLDSWLGLRLPFTTTGAVVAATFVSLPFFILAIESSATQLNTKLEEASLNLGASPIRTFFTVSLPLLRNSIFAGIALSWARALGEFGATITFAGDSPGRTRTLPLQLFVALETNPERAMVIGVLMVAISLSVLVTLRGNWLVQK